eukprot:7376312-Prymnesium_polylepis.1
MVGRWGFRQCMGDGGGGGRCPARRVISRSSAAVRNAFRGEACHARADRDVPSSPRVNGIADPWRRVPTSAQWCFAFCISQGTLLGPLRPC